MSVLNSSSSRYDINNNEGDLSVYKCNTKIQSQDHLQIYNLAWFVQRLQCNTMPCHPFGSRCKTIIHVQIAIQCAVHTNYHCSSTEWVLTHNVNSCLYNNSDEETLADGKFDDEDTISNQYYTSIMNIGLISCKYEHAQHHIKDVSFKSSLMCRQRNKYRSKSVGPDFTV
jgi:hypothetical protein